MSCLNFGTRLGLCSPAAPIGMGTFGEAALPERRCSAMILVSCLNSCSDGCLVGLFGDKEASTALEVVRVVAFGAFESAPLMDALLADNSFRTALFFWVAFLSLSFLVGFGTIVACELKSLEFKRRGTSNVRLLIRFSCSNTNPLINIEFWPENCRRC